jgi:3-hydroxy-9,10-secoandrosta-1,3,5(10)-triene-9,17-dione monooxygenase
MPTKVLTPEELLSKASAMVPILKDRAAHTEELRRIPDETVQDLLSSGLYLIGVPQRFGGLDVDYGLILEAGAELGRGCGSTAWCYSLWSAHAWLVGHWPLEAQEEVFGDGPNVLCSSSLNPGISTLETVSGGFRLSGHWEFSSGCDAAAWIMLGGDCPDGRVWLLVPRSDYEIVDTWFVSGLRGTGSKDIIVKDAFVPQHRIMDMSKAGDGDWTGWEMHRHARYRMPITVLLGWDLVAPIIGIAQGMIEEFTTRLIGTSGPGRTAQSGAVQLRLSQASAEVDAARALLRNDIREIFATAEGSETFSALERARYRRDKAFVTQLCLGAVNRLFDLSGGHSLFDSVALQRHHRDAQAVAHRDGLIMDLSGLQYGRVALGLEPDERI